MGVMSVSYDIDRGKDDVILQIRDTACFSQMFYDNHKKDRYGKFYFWHEGTKPQQEAADWYINEYLIPNIPDRLNGIYKFHKEKPNVSLRAPYWMTLEVDLTKPNATDLYILLVMARYPQENPRFAGKMKELLDEGKTIGHAFVNAHPVCDVGAGHLILSPAPLYFINGGGVIKKEFSLKNVWSDKVFAKLQTYQLNQFGEAAEGKKTTDKWLKPYPENSFKIQCINDIFDPR